jgi:4-hydroxy-3-methylbut-2-en-1-yl diphosphate synthase IspG/GcpE
VRRFDVGNLLEVAILGCVVEGRGFKIEWGVVLIPISEDL